MITYSHKKYLVPFLHGRHSGPEIRMITEINRSKIQITEIYILSAVTHKQANQCSNIFLISISWLGPLV